MSILFYLANFCIHPRVHWFKNCFDVKPKNTYKQILYDKPNPACLLVE